MDGGRFWPTISLVGLFWNWRSTSGTRSLGPSNRRSSSIFASRPCGSSGSARSRVRNPSPMARRISLLWSVSMVLRIMQHAPWFRYGSKFLRNPTSPPFFSGPIDAPRRDACSRRSRSSIVSGSTQHLGHSHRRLAYLLNQGPLRKGLRTTGPQSDGVRRIFL
jgi:hypothetical protein